MANIEENVLLHTNNLEERIMKATGLTKNIVCKMLCDANETEDELEKARILSHFIWHMPAGQLANTEVAKIAKKELVEAIASEIGTEVPEDIMSSLTIEVKDDNKDNIEETKEPVVEEPKREFIEETIMNDPVVKEPIENKVLDEVVDNKIEENVKTKKTKDVKK